MYRPYFEFMDNEHVAYSASYAETVWVKNIIQSYSESRHSVMHQRVAEPVITTDRRVKYGTTITISCGQPSPSSLLNVLTHANEHTI